MPIFYLIVRQLVDRTGLLHGLSQVDGDGSAWAERALGRADEVRWPEPRSRRDTVRLPPSRDFR